MKRSTVTGGPYTPIASAITGTNYTDASVATCQTYYYVVTITNAGNESLPSAEASASVPGGAPPSPWLNADIGSVGLAGSAYVLRRPIHRLRLRHRHLGHHDAFSLFMFMFLSAPIATFAPGWPSVQNTSGNAKAAVMIRESLAANSAMPWRTWSRAPASSSFGGPNTGVNAPPPSPAERRPTGCG